MYSLQPRLTLRFAPSASCIGGDNGSLLERGSRCRLKITESFLRRELPGARGDLRKLVAMAEAALALTDPEFPVCRHPSSGNGVCSLGSCVLVSGEAPYMRACQGPADGYDGRSFERFSFEP